MPINFQDELPPNEKDSHPFMKKVLENGRVIHYVPIEDLAGLKQALAEDLSRKQILVIGDEPPNAYLGADDYKVIEAELKGIKARRMGGQQMALAQILADEAISENKPEKTFEIKAMPELTEPWVDPKTPVIGSRKAVVKKQRKAKKKQRNQARRSRKSNRR